MKEPQDNPPVSQPITTGPPPVEQLVKEYQPRLKRFICRWVSNKEDAEDVLQEVFYQLVRTLGEEAVQIGQLSAWLFRVARNTIISLGRKQHEEPWPVYETDEGEEAWVEFTGTLFDDDNPTPETAYLRSVVWEELEAALAELPTEQRKAFELMELAGIPVKELSRTTGVPVATLLSRKHYAVKHLRNRMRELYQDILNY